MKKLLFILVAFILLASSSCSNDNKDYNLPYSSYFNGIYQKKTGAEKLKLELTFNGKKLTGKSVEVKVDANGEKATLILVGIIPGEVSETIINATLTVVEGKYVFNGTTTATKSRISYSGSIFKPNLYNDCGVLKLDLDVDYIL